MQTIDTTAEWKNWRGHSFNWHVVHLEDCVFNWTKIASRGARDVRKLSPVWPVFKRRNLSLLNLQVIQNALACHNQLFSELCRILIHNPPNVYKIHMLRESAHKDANMYGNCEKNGLYSLQMLAKNACRVEKMHQNGHVFLYRYFLMDFGVFL